MTIVVDSSALIAVLLGERGFEAILHVLADSEASIITAANVVEVGIVGENRLGELGRVERLQQRFGLTVAPVDETLAHRALDAHRRYGRGRHPARLNFGDCFTYALAITLDAPVLCTGDDFARTDLAVIRPDA